MIVSEDTLQALRAALLISPDNQPLRQHLADTLLGLGRFEEAETEYRLALSFMPESQPLGLGLARAFYQQGKNTQAMVDGRRGRAVARPMRAHPNLANMNFMYCNQIHPEKPSDRPF